eukprot:gene846-141_t
MTVLSNSLSSRIARRAVKQGARPSVKNQAEVEKCATGSNHALLKSTKTTLISTFNTRTLKPLDRRYELAAAANKHNIDVVCIKKQHNGATTGP